MTVPRTVVDRHARRVIRPVESRLSAKTKDDASESDSGWIEGYAATWGNVDFQGEMMVKGCFARSIVQNVPAGKVKLMVTHFCNGGDAMECIGTITSAFEDDYGLKIHAELSSVQLAQDIRTKVLEGHVNLLSVGFKPIQWDWRDMATGKDVLAHQESELAEVTVTVRPANPLAAITAAKTETTPSAIDSAAAQSTGKIETGGTGKVAPISPSPSALPRMRREIEARRLELDQLFDS